MDLVAQLRASLLAAALPPPSTAFLAALASLRTPPPPLPSLLATAKARLLACDLARAAALLDASLLPALPAAALAGPAPAPAAAAAAAPAPVVRLPRDVHVQVLDVEDLVRPRWDQVLKLEAVARGERSRGRRVVGVDADADADADADQDADAVAPCARGPDHGPSAAPPPPPPRPLATHRLVLQDCRGNRVYAVELRRVDRIGLATTNIGEKMLLRAGTLVARGVVLLTPETCLLLGGRIDAWHQAWADGCLARLKEAVGA